VDNGYAGEGHSNDFVVICFSIWQIYCLLVWYLWSHNVVEFESIIDL